jgi:hypothetical protein
MTLGTIATRSFLRALFALELRFLALKSILYYFVFHHPHYRWPPVRLSSLTPQFSWFNCLFSAYLYSQTKTSDTPNSHPWLSSLVSCFWSLSRPPPFSLSHIQFGIPPSLVCLYWHRNRLTHALYAAAHDSFIHYDVVIVPLPIHALTPIPNADACAAAFPLRSFLLG